MLYYQTVALKKINPYALENHCTIDKSFVYDDIYINRKLNVTNINTDH